MTIPYPSFRYACVPTALSKLFGETYDETCQRLYAVGAVYTHVTIEALYDLLLELRGVQEVYEPDISPSFMQWRRWKRGAWVAVVTHENAPSSHCVALKDGVVLDNGWLRAEDPTILLHAAWRLEEKAA